MKKIFKLTIILIFAIFTAGCGILPQETILAESPDATIRPTPGYTLSPLYTPSPTQTASPSASPDAPPQSEEYYIYTLDEGTGEYPYAWTIECPIKGEIKYGTYGSDEVRALQGRLAQLGFYCGGATGSFNNLTLIALNEFQDVVGIERTQDLTRETIDVLYSPNGIKAMSIEKYEIPAGILEGITVFVDAGHGGNATGTARGSLVEKTAVLEASYRLKAMLEKAGARVIMTRTDDSAISLTYRSALVNDVILSDQYDETESEIQKLLAKIDAVNSLERIDAEGLTGRAQTLLENINNMLKPLNDAKQYAEAMLDEFGKASTEYVNAKKSLTELEVKAEELREEYELIMNEYYFRLLGVDLDLYEEKYNARLNELIEYKDKLVYYRELLKVNLDTTNTEYEGIWEKAYDANGNKIINPDLKEILDITGEKCNDKYIFISVHINGVDNADYVNGTEIYVRNINSSNNNYGVNKYYYSGYNIAQRAKFASSIKTAMDNVIPLENGKNSVIKDSDLWVLREINIPCVLVETGYVTNSYDRIKLLNPQTRNAFAYALYCGVCDYYLG